MAVETWDETTFSQFYQVRDRVQGSPTFGQLVGYTRNGMSPYSAEVWERIAAAFPIQPADRVLIVGCAFGFTIEAAKAAGFPNVYGIDSSPYVASARGVEADAGTVIVEDTVRGGGRIRAALRSATGDDVFDWIITEDVVSCYADADVVSMAPHLESLLAGADALRVVHWTVSTFPGGYTGDSALTWHTLAEWKALVPAHSWFGPAEPGVVY